MLTTNPTLPTTPCILESMPSIKEYLYLAIRPYGDLIFGSRIIYVGRYCLYVNKKYIYLILRAEYDLSINKRKHHGRMMSINIIMYLVFS